MCSGECEAGYKCPVGSSSPDEEPCSEESHHYCPAGSSEPTTVDSGYYTFPESGNTRFEQRICPRGSYCTGGERKDCPAGRYGNEEGLTDDSCSGECEKGFRCPKGSEEATQISCGDDEDHPASVFCPAGVGEKQQVEENYYSVPESEPEDQRYDQEPCPDEYVCENGKRYRRIEFLPDVSASSGSDTKFCETKDDDTSFRGGQAVVPERDHDGEPFTRITVKTRVDGVSFSLKQELDPDGPDPDGECSGSVRSPFGTEHSGPDNDGVFEVEPKVTSSDSLDFQNCPQYLITLVVSAEDTPDVECQFVVQVADQNSPPEFPEGNYVREVSELASVNDPVGDAILAENRQSGQEVRYSIVSEDGGGPNLFSIGTCSGQITVAKAELDFAEQEEHELRIKAEDDGVPPLDDETTVTIKLIEEPQPPFFVEDRYEFNIDEFVEGGTKVSGGGTDGKITTDDPNKGATVSFIGLELVEGDGGDNPFSITSDGGDGILYFDRDDPLDSERATTYRLRVTITDGEFEVSTSSIIVEVNSVPQPPRINLPSGSDEQGSTLFNVDEMTASDENVGPEFTVIDRDDGEVDMDCKVVVNDLDDDEIFGVSKVDDGEYQIKVTTTDESDLNHKEHRYLNCVLECKVSGVEGAPVGKEDIVIEINHVNKEPSIDDVHFKIREDARSSALVGAGHEFNARNPDEYMGVSLFYRLPSDENSQDVLDFFSISFSSGNISLRSNQLNFTEQVWYHATVQVEDNGSPSQSASSTASIEVLDVNQAPVVDPDQVFHLDENSKQGTCVNYGPHNLSHVVAWDPDGERDKDLTWSIDWAPIDSLGTVPNRSLIFEIDQEGHICVAPGVDTNIWTTPLNYEAPTPYTSGSETGIWKVEVTVSDNGINGSVLHGSADVAIQLNDVNDPPRLNHTTRSTMSRSSAGSQVGSSALPGEDQDEGHQERLRYSLLDDGDADGKFRVASNGTIFLTEEAANLDQDQEKQYTLTVQVEDPKGAIDVQNITVVITGKNEPPEMNDQTFSIPEDHPLGRVNNATIQFHDEVDGLQHTFFVTGWRPSRAESMVSVTSDGQIEIVEDGLFFADVPEIEMDVVIEDDGVGQLTDSAIITIDVLDRPIAPEIETSELEVDELVDIGTSVGLIDVWDPDIDETHTFRINNIQPERPDEQPFVIDAATGEVKTNAKINFEAEWLPLEAKYYRINVTVTDKDGLTDSSIIRIDIGDVNERPFIVGGDTSNGTFWFTIPENRSPGNPARGLRVHRSQGPDIPDIIDVDDPDHDDFSHGTLTFELLESSVQGVWEIDSETGEISLESPVDYEDVDWYELYILVRDNDPEGPLGINVTAIIIIEDVNDLAITSFNVSDDIPTSGGSFLRITGRNFGPTMRKLNHRGASQDDVNVYGGSGRDVDEWTVEFESDHCYVAVPNTEIECRIPPGVGSVKWRFDTQDVNTLENPESYPVDASVPPKNGDDIIAASEQWSTTSLDFVYRSPSIEAIFVYSKHQDGMSTAGGEEIHIFGEDFGPFSNTSKDINIDVEIETEFDILEESDDGSLEAGSSERSFSARSCSLKRAHKEIICLSPVGVGHSLEWTVTIGDDGNDDSAALSSSTFSAASTNLQYMSMLDQPPTGKIIVDASQYSRPRVDQVRIHGEDGFLNRMDTRGGNRIRIYGENFGSNDAEVFAFGVQFSSVSREGEAPSIPSDGNSTDNTSLPAAVNSSMLQFIDLDAPILSIGGVDCEVKQDHTEIECESIPGLGVGYVWHVFVGGQQSSLKDVFNASMLSIEDHTENITTSYFEPVITSVEGNGVENADTRGGEVVQLTGDYFGKPTTGAPNYEAFEGDYETLWEFASVDVTRALEQLHEFRVFFGRPETLTGDDGSEETIEGPFDTLPMLNARFELRECEVLSHSRIECLTPEGTGKGFVYVLRVGGQASSVFYGAQNVSNYHPPIISYHESVEEDEFGDTSLDPFDTRGGDTVLIVGQHFGAETQNIGKVVYGDESSEAQTIVTYDGDELSVGGADMFEARDCYVRVPHEQLVCTTVPGAGTRLSWSVIIDNQRSVSPSTSYEVPMIESIDGPPTDYVSTFGGDEIIIHGKGFGPPTNFEWKDPRSGESFNYTFLEWVKYGPTGEEYEAADCKVLNHSAIRCKTVSGTGQNHVFRVKVEQQLSPVSIAEWSYAAPVIEEIDYSSSNTKGGTRVYLRGRHFGTEDDKTTIYVRFAKWDDWLSTMSHRVIGDENGFPKEEVQFILPEGAGVNRSVELVVRMKDSSRSTQSDPVFSNEVMLHYEKPRVHGFRRFDEGDEWRLELLGENFGSDVRAGIISASNVFLPKEPEVTRGNRIASWTHDQIDIMYDSTEGEFAVLVAKQIEPGHPNSGFPKRPSSGPREGGVNHPEYHETDEVPLSAVSPSFQDVDVVKEVSLPTRGGKRLEFSMRDVRTNGTEITIGSSQLTTVYLDDEVTVYSGRDVQCRLVSGFPRLIENTTNEYDIACITPEGQGVGQDMEVELELQVSDPIPLDYAAPTVRGITVIGFKPGDVRSSDLDGSNVDFDNLLFLSGESFSNHPFRDVDLSRSSAAEDALVFSNEDIQANVSVDVQNGRFFAQVPTFGAVIVLFGDDFGITSFFDGFRTPDHPFADPLNSTHPNITRTYSADGGKWTFEFERVARFAGKTSEFSEWSHEFFTNSKTIDPSELDSLSSLLSHEHASVAIPAGVMHDLDEISAQSVEDSSKFFTRSMEEGETRFGYIGDDPISFGGTVISLINDQDNPYELIFSSGHPGLDSEQNLQSHQSVHVRYSPPTLVSQKLTSPTTGGSLLVIRGINFGDSLVTFPEVFVNGRECRLLLEEAPIPGSSDTVLKRAEPDPHSTIFCMAPEGSGTSQTVAVNVGTQSTEESVAIVNYDPPVVKSISPANGPTAGNITVRIHGNNFGAEPDTSAPIRLIADPDESPLWKNPHIDVPSSEIYFWNHTLIIFRLPEGQGELKQVDVIINGQSALEDGVSEAVFLYDPPVVTEIDRKCPTGGCLITVIGNNFGLPVCEPGPNSVCHPFEPVEVDVPSSEEEDWENVDSTTFSEDDIVFKTIACRRPTDVSFNSSHTHTSIQCRLPEGFGSDLPLRVHVGQRVSDDAHAAYEAAIIDSFSPNTPNAISEETLTIRGRNFGVSGPPINVTIGDVDCLEPTMIADHNRLSCQMQEDTVGSKSLTVWVALQTNFFPASERLVAYECVEGYYGQPGELCVECPEGAVCPRPRCQRFNEDNDLICEEYNEPKAAEGFWRTYVPVEGSDEESDLAETSDITEDSGLCHEERLNRPGKWAGSCPVFVACSPKDACIGENECAEAYTGHRCNECADGFFRMDGACRTCPSQPILLLTAFILGVICAAGIGYQLNKKQVNLAFVMIGIDYFQVLGMFARSQIEWPQFVRDFFSAMSIFNLNIDLAAPECTLEGLGYGMKWAAVMLLPIGIFSVFLVIHVVKYIQKRFIRRVSSAKRNSHLPIMIGASVTTMYILYFQLTRTTFEVFNCGPTDPDDGYRHGYMQVVFEPCFKSGELHIQLFPWALVTSLVYVIGFPVFAIYKLKRNKKIVKIDQYLRTKGFGGERHLSSQECYQFRKKYQKLYYNFKPGKWYWISVILLRKFAISVTALMFQRSPAFQMALAMLVLFASFSVHVKHFPFMSAMEYRSQWLYHRKRVKEGDAKHMMLDAEIRDIFRKTENMKRVQKVDMKSIIEKSREGPTSSFTNHNTVEAVLLGVAMLVSLSGVMFQSRKFADGNNSSGKEALGIATIILIILSLIYFAIVVFAELSSGLCPNWFQRHCKVMTKKKSTIELEEEQKELLGETEGKDAGTAVNPMMMMQQADQAGKSESKGFDESIVNQIAEALESPEPPTLAMWATMRAYMEKLQNDVDSMHRQLKLLQRRSSMTRKTAEQSKAALKLSSTKKSRQQFNQVASLQRSGYGSGAATRARGRGSRRGGRGRGGSSAKFASPHVPFE